MATTSSPGAGIAPRRSKRWLTESCSRPGSRRANSTAPPAPMATRAATTATTTARRDRPWRGVRRIGQPSPAREVTLSGADDDRAAGAQVAHRDAAARDARQRPVAAVGDEPGRPAHGDDAVARARAEAGRGDRGPTASAAGAGGRPRRRGRRRPGMWAAPRAARARSCRGRRRAGAPRRARRGRCRSGWPRRAGRPAASRCRRGYRRWSRPESRRRRRAPPRGWRPARAPARCRSPARSPRWPEDGGRGGRGRELRPRQRRRRGGGRQGRCRTLPRRGERRKRHVVAVRDATVVGGHEAQVVCRRRPRGPRCRR